MSESCCCRRRQGRKGSKGQGKMARRGQARERASRGIASHKCCPPTPFPALQNGSINYVFEVKQDPATAHPRLDVNLADRWVHAIYSPSLQASTLTPPPPPPCHRSHPPGRQPGRQLL